MASKKTSPAEFVRQVRQETTKVTWPARKETGVTTGMVFIMVTLMAIFFLLADQILAFGVRMLLGIGG
ncbi:MAG: preprotein translocase subunit SecE [Alphaproteobacteria bacterium]